ncbi:hypothetical protein AB1Y20_019633 [Prymnesium parvum]|uniref:Hexosyltransferase n=1 Tax=Prymnesium parvum TaxID=97485 RepID=A0AB34JT01_PRYPA
MAWLVAHSLLSFSHAHAEEEALARMLTLHLRSLASERPLPLSELHAHPSCPAPTAGSHTSPSAGVSPRSAIALRAERLFQQTSAALREGEWTHARLALEQTCEAALAVSEETRRRGAELLLSRWHAECEVLLRHLPATPPAAGDHARLLLLLHELGGALLLFGLLGVLPEPVVGLGALHEVAMAINEFGTTNRKTAVSMALWLGATDHERVHEALELLRRYQMCGEREDGSLVGEEERDAWADVGVRLCATLLLRTGRAEEALALLKRVAGEARTVHAFLSLFELSGRLPFPSNAPEARPRFTQEQMLEVLEAALRHPHHAAASEPHLLAWQLRTNLNFGHAHAPAPPFHCPPHPRPSPPPPLSLPPLSLPPPHPTPPRLLIVVPFVARERARLEAALRRWAVGGAYAPCASGAPALSVDLLLYLADPPGLGAEGWRLPLPRLLHGAHVCFRDISLRHANLTKEEQYYAGGWDNTGPNNLFYRLFFDPAVHDRYDVLMWMETDVYPIINNWLPLLYEEARAPRIFWRKGPSQQSDLAHGMVSTHHYHMNSAGLYRLGEPCFVALMERVQEEHPHAPHDVSTHLFLHDPRHFHIWKQHAHRFMYTDIVQNHLGEWTANEVLSTSPDTAFVHGKHYLSQDP